MPVDDYITYPLMIMLLGGPYGHRNGKEIVVGDLLLSDSTALKTVKGRKKYSSSPITDERLDIILQIVGSNMNE